MPVDIDGSRRPVLCRQDVAMTASGDFISNQVRCGVADADVDKAILAAGNGKCILLRRIHPPQIFTSS